MLRWLPTRHFSSAARRCERASGPSKRSRRRSRRSRKRSRLYAGQLQRLDELQAAAWQQELSIQELSAPDWGPNSHATPAAAAQAELPGPDGETASAGEPPAQNARRHLYMAPVAGSNPDDRRQGLPPYRELVRAAKALQSRAQQYETLAAEVRELRPKARRFDELVEEVKVLRFKARRFDELAEEVKGLHPKARHHDGA